MEFKITGKYNETYLEECLTMWKFASKEAFNSVKTYSICCLVYLTFGLLYYLRGKPISLFISSFGLACFLLLIIQLVNIYQLKTKAKKNLLARIDKYKSDLTALRELIFTEDCIKYCDPEMLLELKWAAISHYQEYRNYVFFFLNESKKPAFSMDKNNIPESIEKNLFILINSKISTGN
jgi:YcxB-like protein